jgi:hypothetical protein
MQGSEDMAAGRLETEAELRKREPESRDETPDPMQPAIDAVENWLSGMSARAAAAQVEDPLQPFLDSNSRLFRDTAAPSE